MPCFITGSEEGDRRLGEAELLNKAQKLNRMLCYITEFVVRTEIIDVTRSGDLSNILSSLGDSIGYSKKEAIELSNDIEKYYHEHKKIDEERKKKAQKKYKAELKKKLTKELDEEQLEVLRLMITDGEL